MLIEWWDYHLKQVNRENFKANKNLSKLNPILGANNQPIILIYAIIKYLLVSKIKWTTFLQSIRIWTRIWSFVNCLKNISSLRGKKRLILFQMILKKNKTKQNKRLEEYTFVDTKGCLVCVFKQPFSVFKQYFMYFYILFHPHVFL